jgi:hypothetical protein
LYRQKEFFFANDTTGFGAAAKEVVAMCDFRFQISDFKFQLSAISYQPSVQRIPPLRCGMTSKKAFGVVCGWWDGGGAE